MYFKQLVKEDLGCASYLVGDTDAGVCAVVDPRLEMVEDILELVAAKGMRTTFIAELTVNLPPRPPNMRTIVERNRSGSTHLPAALIPTPFTAQSVQHEMERGALVLDSRSPEQFGEAHIPGAVFVALHGPAFATRVGFVVPSNARLVLVIKDERDLHEAVKQLAVVGYDQVVGFLQGGMAAWQEAGLPVQQVSQLSVEELASRHALTILDVRDRGEWDEGHIKHFFQGWETYQGYLTNAIAPLTSKQLDLRAQSALDWPARRTHHCRACRLVPCRHGRRTCRSYADAQVG